MYDRRLHRPYVSTDSFIVEWCANALSLRRFISPHWWLVTLIPPLKGSYRFVDSWVLGHFLGSIFLFLTASTPSLGWLEWLAVGYGGIIVVEGFLYEVDLLMFGGYRKAREGQWHYVLGHRRLVATSLLNYVAIIFWFAIFYRHWAGGFAWIPQGPDSPAIPTDRFLAWLRLSFYTMTSFGDSPIGPSDMGTSLLTLAQSAIGVFMALLIIASFVRLLPEPGSRTRFEQEPPPYHPRYDPGAKTNRRRSRRSLVMSRISRESLALAAAIGAFLMAALSLLLGYSLLSGLTTRGGVPPVSCCVGICLVIFGMVATVLAASWLGFTSWRETTPKRDQ
jgi:hypothetical protein